MKSQRLPFMVLALVSLVAGILAGLYRMGWSLPVAKISPGHGAIMVGGFLGTLITLEKIIPLKRSILYVIPFVSGSSVAWFYMDMPVAAVMSLLFSSGALMIVFMLYFTRERSLIYALMFAGAVCWFIGNFLLLNSNFYPSSLPWWMAFTLLIISAERLELMKFLPVSTAQKIFYVSALVIFVGSCLLYFHGVGSYIACGALIGVSLWLMRHDVIGIGLRKRELTRYVSVALLSGYVALLFSGLFLPLLAPAAMGYDALIHTFFIGFVFSMIFAHGPIILPGVLGISVKPYHPVLYGWLLLLHLSWTLRTVADIMLYMEMRQLSGVISALAIAGYFITLMTLTVHSYRAKAL